MDIFCKIINNEIPSYTIYEDEIVKVILDTNQNCIGHSLIIPKKHSECILDIDDETLDHINKISREIVKLLMNKLNCDGVTLIQNNKYKQEVKHYHLHLMPKYIEDKELTIKETYELLTK